MKRTEDYKREFISILFVQKHLIFWATFAIFLGAVLVATFWPATFTAEGSILVSGKQLTEPNPEALKPPEVRTLEVTLEDLQSEVEILRAPAVVSNALEYLSVSYPDLLSQGAVPSDLVFEVSRNLSIETIPDSNVISIHYQNKNPAFAADFVNVLMEQYIIYRMNFYKAEVARLSPKFLEEQIDGYLEELRENEDELIALVDATGVASPAEEIQNNIVLKKRLEESLSSLTSTYIDKKTTLTNLESALESKDLQYFSFVESEIIRDLSSNLANLLNERGKVARTYLPESEVMVRINEQIDTTFANLKAEVLSLVRNSRNELAAIEEKMSNLEAAIAIYADLNVAMGKQIIETERIKRESALLQASLESLSQRKGEVEINDMIGTGDASMRYVSILSRALTPSEATFPRPHIIIPLGVIIGLITGCTLGFLREYFDHTFKSPSDVQAYTGLPVLFSLAKPHGSHLSLVYVSVIFVLCLGMLAFLLWQQVFRNIF